MSRTLPDMNRCPCAKCMETGWLLSSSFIHSFIHGNRVQIRSASAISSSVLPYCYVEVTTALSGSLVGFISCAVWYIFSLPCLLSFWTGGDKRAQPLLSFYWFWHLTRPLSCIRFFVMDDGVWVCWQKKKRILLILWFWRFVQGQTKSDLEYVPVLTKFRLYAKFGFSVFELM